MQLASLHLALVGRLCVQPASQQSASQTGDHLLSLSVKLRLEETVALAWAARCGRGRRQQWPAAMPLHAIIQLSGHVGLPDAPPTLSRVAHVAELQATAAANAESKNNHS